MKKDFIDHLALHTDDIKKSVDWYIKNFHCEILYQDDSWAMLEFENIKLALVLPEQHPFHFAVLKDDVENYGIPIKHRDGSVSVYIKDRSGNNIEVLRYDYKHFINQSVFNRFNCNRLLALSRFILQFFIYYWINGNSMDNQFNC